MGDLPFPYCRPQVRVGPRIHMETPLLTLHRDGIGGATGNGTRADTGPAG